MRRPLRWRAPPLPTLNGFTLLALIVLAVGIFVAFRAGALRERRAMREDAPLRPLVVAPAASAPASVPPTPPPVPAAPAADPLPSPGATPPPLETLEGERFRLVLGLETETAALRQALRNREAEALHLRGLAEERRRLFGELASARADTARYRQIIVDLENNAPPPLLDGPGAPDDLKLIVGVGPVLERMLQQLGIATYRQIARWSERDIDEFDAKLPEFHGRIRRDGWVTQARALHQSKYGEPAAPARG